MADPKTTTATAPTTAPTTEAEAPEKSNETHNLEYDLQVSAQVLPMLQTYIQKGRGKGNEIHLFRADLTQDDPFQLLILAVGKENWNRWLAARVREAFIDATHDAMDKDGLIRDIDLAREIPAQFQPGSHKSKEGVKVLKDKQAELLLELAPMLKQQAEGKKLSTEDSNRLLGLMVQFADVSEKLEVKSRKGKKAAATPVAKAA